MTQITEIKTSTQADPRWTSRLKVRRTSTYRATLDYLNGIEAPIFAVEVAEEAWAPHLMLDDMVAVAAAPHYHNGKPPEHGAPALVEGEDGELYLAHVGFSIEPGDTWLGLPTLLTRVICSGPAGYENEIPGAFAAETSAARLAREKLDAILAEALDIWKAWRAENPPLLHVEGERITDEYRAYEDARYDAHVATRAPIPTDKASLLALTADERVWPGGEIVCETIAEAMPLSSLGQSRKQKRSATKNRGGAGFPPCLVEMRD
ncbi:MAG: hypothetical protein GEU80_17060 [Dehalococcoidia bacterium]|nr:hypothetical protein [Dehalococcoidia bacterium]